MAQPPQWRHNGRDGVSNHQPHDCLLNRLFRRRSKKTSKVRVTDLCGGNSPVTGEFPAQMASNAENVSIWWRHHGVHSSWRTDIIVVTTILSFLFDNKSDNFRAWYTTVCRIMAYRCTIITCRLIDEMWPLIYENAERSSLRYCT